MAFELTSHQRDNFGRIAKAKRRTMNWNKAFPRGNVIKQCLGLRRLNGIDVGVEHEAIVLTERLGIEFVNLFGIGELDAPLCHNWFDNPEPQ